MINPNAYIADTNENPASTPVKTNQNLSITSILPPPFEIGTHCRPSDPPTITGRDFLTRQ
jgi:hypothetical protein